MKKIAILIVTLLLAAASYAQTEIPYSQIIKNPVWVNPAYQGLNKGLSLDVAYKRQWQGFDGAPNTMGFNLHNSFDKIRLGIGIDGHFEEAGYRNNNKIGLNLNTMVRLSQHSDLLFGLSLGMDLRRYKSFGDAVSDIDFGQYQHTYDRESFVGGFGLAYKWRGLTVGASGSMTFLKGDDVSNMSSVFVNAEYEFQLGKGWNVRPMALYAYNDYWDSYEEIGVMGGYDKIIEVGAAYRFDRCVTILADLKITKFLSIGYSYDINTGELSDLAGGSHEFGLKFSTAELMRK